MEPGDRFAAENIEDDDEADWEEEVEQCKN
jgi:hypothetical protein